MNKTFLLGILFLSSWLNAQTFSFTCSVYTEWPSYSCGKPGMMAYENGQYTITQSRIQNDITEYRLVRYELYNVSIKDLVERYCSTNGKGMDYNNDGDYGDILTKYWYTVQTLISYDLGENFTVVCYPYSGLDYIYTRDFNPKPLDDFLIWEEEPPNVIVLTQAEIYAGDIDIPFSAIITEDLSADLSITSGLPYSDGNYGIFYNGTHEASAFNPNASSNILSEIKNGETIWISVQLAGKEYLAATGCIPSNLDDYASEITFFSLNKHVLVTIL